MKKIVFGQTTGGGEQPCQTTFSPLLLSPYRRGNEDFEARRFSFPELENAVL